MLTILSNYYFINSTSTRQQKTKQSQRGQNKQKKLTKRKDNNSPPKKKFSCVRACLMNTIFSMCNSSWVLELEENVAINKKRLWKAKEEMSCLDGKLREHPSLKNTNHLYLDWDKNGWTRAWLYHMQDGYNGFK